MEKRKSIYHFRGFDGQDASIEISIREYGLAWKMSGRNGPIFVVGYDKNGEEYISFYFSSITRDKWAAMIVKDWFRRDKVEKYVGHSLDDFNPWNVYDAISYHGAENVLGSPCGTFKIA